MPRGACMVVRTHALDLVVLAFEQGHAQRVLAAAFDGGGDPVIKKDPGTAAWTHAVTDKAMAK